MAKKILFLDDEPDMLEIFKVYLGRAGYDVTALGDGQSGLEAAKAEQFDLIVTDVAMPVMTDLNFLKR